MDKIDLIIAALESIYYTKDTSIIQNALTAARELKALKPVAYVGGLNEFDAMRLKSEGFHMYTPLHALDGEQA